MSHEQLSTRILAENTKISSDKMRKGEISKDDWKTIVNVSKDLELSKSEFISGGYI